MNMRLPTLQFLANTSVHIQLASGTDENGELLISKEIDVKARKESTNSVIYTAEGTKVTMKMKLFIFKKLDEFSDEFSNGFCTVESNQYDIVSIGKVLNPDGSVNHIVLGLI